MTTRHMFNRGMLFNADAGSGNGATQNDGNANNAASNNADSGNNSSPNAGEFDNLWERPENRDNNNNQQQQNNNQNNNQNNQQQQRTSADVINEHIRNSVGAIKFDAQKVGQQLQDGDMSGFEEAITEYGHNMYRNMMAQMGQYVTSKVNSAVEEAVKKSTGTVNSGMAVSKMHDALKFTSQPAIKPMAEAVFNQLLGKGKTVDEAIKGVGDYYNSIARTVSGTGNRRPGTGNFSDGRPGGGNFDGNDAIGDDIDWVSALSAKSQ